MFFGTSRSGLVTAFGLSSQLFRHANHPIWRGTYGVHTLLKFEWDATKAHENIRKHGISFREAESAFEDAHAMMLPDPDHSLAEDRFILLGMGSSLGLLTIAFTFRNGSEVIRIISARRATRYERAQYAWRARMI